MQNVIYDEERTFLIHIMFPLCQNHHRHRIAPFLCTVNLAEGEEEDCCELLYTYFFNHKLFEEHKIRYNRLIVCVPWKTHLNDPLKCLPCEFLWNYIRGCIYMRNLRNYWLWLWWQVQRNVYRIESQAEKNYDDESNMHSFSYFFGDLRGMTYLKNANFS